LFGLQGEFMVISVKNLTVEYRVGSASFPALDIRRGKSVIESKYHLRPSGSGKSTLLNVLADCFRHERVGGGLWGAACRPRRIRA